MKRTMETNVNPWENRQFHWHQDQSQALGQYKVLLPCTLVINYCTVAYNQGPLALTLSLIIIRPYMVLIHK